MKNKAKRETDGSTAMPEFPLEEIQKTLAAMAWAEKTEDVKAILWLAKRLQWLHGMPPRKSVLPRNRHWRVEADPPPETIAAILSAAEEDGLLFDEPPRIGHRGDALALLDSLLEAGNVEGIQFALLALRDAIQRGIV